MTKWVKSSIISPIKEGGYIVEEINLAELFRFLMSKMKFIILMSIIAVGLCMLYITFVLTPMYHSSTTLILVGNNENQNLSLVQSEVNLNQNLVTTYSEIVKSRSVLNQVIEVLDLPCSAEELSGRIHVTSIEDTEIIKIQVSDENNETAKEIASATSEVFMKEIQKIYKLTNVSVVDEASLEKDPYNINVPKQLLIAAILGFGLASSLAFLVFYFDTSIKSSKDIEEKLGLAILGNVTIANKNKGGKK